MKQMMQKWPMSFWKCLQHSRFKDLFVPTMIHDLKYIDT